MPEGLTLNQPSQNELCVGPENLLLKSIVNLKTISYNYLTIIVYE